MLDSERQSKIYISQVLEYSMEAYVGEWLTARTLDLKLRGSNLARGVVSLDKKLYFTLSLFTQVDKWVPATY